MTETKFKLVQIHKLAGQDCQGLLVDVRSRYKNGRLFYPNHHTRPILTKLIKVCVRKEKPDGVDWLFWYYNPTSETPDGSSGVTMPKALTYYLHVGARKGAA